MRGLLHGRQSRLRGKVAIASLLMLALSGCWSHDSNRVSDKILTVLLYSPPITLHPRNAIDSVGQQLGALMFRGLTKLDANLEVQGDLAESWKLSSDGKRYTFTLREGIVDHEGNLITAELVARCLENYRGATGKASRHAAAFPTWKSTQSRGREVTIAMDRTDPYLPKNVLLLRYYRAQGDAQNPCRDSAAGEALVTSGMMRPDRWQAAPDVELNLLPVSLPAHKPIRFVFVGDENSRASKLMRGDVDVVLNAFSLSRTRWVEKELADRFKLLERSATTVSYLAFNLRDPIVSKREVRQAISLAIDRESWVKNKMFSFGSVAPSILFPAFSESHAIQFSYDPARAEALLDQAGFPRREDGVRFQLRQKLTSFRESLEQALFFQQALHKIGIDLKLDVVEPAVWAESIKRGAYQISAGRFVGVSDGSIFYGTMRTGQNLNRAGFSNAEVDRTLDHAMGEPDSTKRRKLLRSVQVAMAEELPYFPLWYWSNGLIMRRELSGLSGPELSLSGGLEPLLKIR
jgi:peptide/nickel transport system substrate-binding protein